MNTRTAMPTGSSRDTRNIMNSRVLALSVLAILIGTSCHHRALVHRSATAGVASALEQCIRGAGYKGEGSPDSASPLVIAALRSCFAKYVRAPTFQRWAAQLPHTIKSERLREGDRLFIDVLRDCAERKGLAIDIEATEGSSVRIRPRNQRTDAFVESRDPAFIACTETAEKAERSHLETVAQRL